MSEKETKNAPKEQKSTAFISHVVEDKERFVRPFAAVLRETHGVDAWVDEWEIQPGEKIAEKIYDALAKVDVAVVVLSENSVDSKWVKYEINAALIHRVNKDTKLIPVVLDGLPSQRIPSALHDILQVRVDAGDHKGAAEKINRAIQGRPIVEKPPLATDAGMGISDQLARTIPPARKLGVLLQMAESGNALTQNTLGVIYAEGEGVPQNYAEAVKWFRRAAEQGDAQAQCNLGLMYGKGIGVQRDNAEAVKWFRCAAEQEDAQAQFGLGVMYHEGGGVPQDDAEAVKWYRRAAEQGDPQASLNLGIQYQKGEGVPQNYAEAAKWYRRAAEQGNAQAQYNLGVAYHEGNGVRQDNVEAVQWYRRAAEQGEAQAQYNLGLMYGKGMGVRRDNAEAVEWIHRAAEQGMPEAMDILGIPPQGGGGKE